jgi:GNAT superfamily N-acetyltransferase
VETGDGRGAGSYRVRAARPEDRPAIVELLSRTLGWEDDGRHRALFDWKHRDNPFGVSPGWVAEDEAGVVGSRTLMRWRFQVDGETVTAVRAVDTATHPRAQGRGVFRTLTMRGVEELTAAGVDWVFNTPNDRSAPGYVAMGWRPLGHLPVVVRPSGPAALARLARARHPAELWSVPTPAGEPAAGVLADAAGVGELLDSQPSDPRVRTERSPAYLQWRYGACPAGYRAVLAGPSPAAGVAVFRLRRRGPATEAVIGEVLAPGGAPSVRRRLWRAVLEGARPDYLIDLGRPPSLGWLPVPGNGPLLTWRPLVRPDAPPIRRWALTAGDVELF